MSSEEIELLEVMELLWSGAEVEELWLVVLLAPSLSVVETFGML